MERARLRTIIEELRAELEQTAASESEARERLAGVIGEIEALVDSESGPSRPQPSLMERLREATRHFEESHPNLTSTAGRFIDALNNLGI